MANLSLYRRYRPRRFSELKGQDHVVRALRDSVASGREGQAYLFSGPRGTGKTTSARILAKVLNCERPVDGEPCCECESCVAVERGTSYDVHELDAASNNGVDAMRDLIEKAALGTPGRHKVYILDEVHMLSKAAEAALLKTLEEPPAHVVFVLATTEPQRVSDTIRSRTQHLRFHLLAADALADHIRWVAGDAGLGVSDAAIDAAVAQSGGSARDALSALELLVNSGDDSAGSIALDEFVDALADHDPGRALAAMARAVNAGHDPRAIAEALVRHLRDAFLTLMAPELVQLPQPQVDALAERSRQVGAAALVRAVERLGEVLVELRHAPDPRVLIDVALVQLTSDSGPAGGTVAGEHLDELTALAGRVSRLEQALADAPAVSPAAPVDPATGRTTLGGRARRGVEHSTVASGPAASTLVEASDVTTDAPGSPATDDAVALQAVTSSHDLQQLWESTVRPSLRGMARALYTTVELVDADGEVVRLAAPNAIHRDKCSQHLAEVEAALAAAGVQGRVELVVDGAPTGAAPPDDAGGVLIDEGVDVDDLVDGPPGPVTTPIERITQAFPGAHLVDERD